MIQNRDVKKAIQNIIINDGYIMNTLKFNKDDIQIRKDISESFDFNKKYINIYEKPSEKTVNPDVRMTVYEIDILVSNKLPESKSTIAYADLCAEQIQCLLHDSFANPYTILQFLGMVGNVASNPNQYQIGLQFGTYQTIGGKPKIG